MTTNTQAAPLVALISATPAAIGPAASGLAKEFPEAIAWNILDDRLLKDASARGGVTPPLADRMRRLICHAIAEGANGILLTCSLYGSVAHQVTGAGIPILAADDAAFETAIGGNYGRVLVVASFDAALLDAVERFERAVDDAGASVQVFARVPDGAFEATQTGDGDALLRSLVEAGRAFDGRVDAVLLAQYSLAPAANALSAELGLPVISGPDAASAALRVRILAPTKAGVDG